jgi:hypothetical protein
MVWGIIKGEAKQALTSLASLAMHKRPDRAMSVRFAERGYQCKFPNACKMPKNQHNNPPIPPGYRGLAFRVCFGSQGAATVTLH